MTSICLVVFFSTSKVVGEVVSVTNYNLLQYFADEILVYLQPLSQGYDSDLFAA